MNVFLDLDGTLIDGRKRLFSVFSDIVKGNKLTFTEYWRLRLDGYSNERILTEFHHGSHDLEMFGKSWFEKIESWEYLSLDEPFSGTGVVLQKLSEKGQRPVIVTNRRHKQNLFRQLEQWSWTKLVGDVLATENVVSKSDLILRRFGPLSPNDIFVGDTEADVQDGKALGIRTVAVKSGIRGPAILEMAKPDFTCESIEDIIALNIFQ